MDAATTATALWGAVVLSGLYHGLSPGMGWPLAVSAAMLDRTPRSLAQALVALAFGHLIAMLLILLPFSALTALVDWQREIQIAAAILVIGLGLYLLVTRAHPRFLARVPPNRLVLWSFLAAMAHGAGLMLVPIYLGICGLDVGPDAGGASGSGHAAAQALMAPGFWSALQVALLHTAAMSIAGSLLAVAVYLWLGLRFVRLSWFNLDVVWALSLVLVGGVALFGGHA